MIYISRRVDILIPIVIVKKNPSETGLCFSSIFFRSHLSVLWLRIDILYLEQSNSYYNFGIQSIGIA